MYCQSSVDRFCLVGYYQENRTDGNCETSNEDDGSEGADCWCEFWVGREKVAEGLEEAGNVGEG